MAIDYKKLLRDSIDKIKALNGELNAFKRRIHEPIAVIGMVCRFPGDTHSPAQFWELLRE